MKKNKIFQIIQIFLVLSLCIGVFTRIARYTQWQEFIDLELKRAHSHLGIFSVIVPLIWVSEVEYLKKIERMNFFYFYFAICLVNFVAFLHSGYNVVSHISSVMIQCFWFYIFFSSNIKKTSILKNILVAQVISLGLVFLIYLNKTFSLNFKLLPQLFVLQILFLYGYVGVINKFDKNITFSIQLLFSLLGFCFMFLFDLPLFFNIFILSNFGFVQFKIILFNKNISPSFRLSNIVLFCISFFKSINLFVTNHYFMIAGLHFIILGVLVGELFNFKNSFLKYLFIAITYLMSLAILLQAQFPQYYLNIELILIVLGIFLISVIIFNSLFRLNKSRFVYEYNRLEF